MHNESHHETVTPLGGHLPEGWSLRSLGKLCVKIGSGSTPRGGTKAYVPAGTSFVRSQNVFDHRFSVDGLAFIDDKTAANMANVEVRPHDVLLNITGDGVTIARCCVVPDSILPARVNQHVVIIRPNSSLNPRYLQSYLSLPSIREYMLNFNSGGSRRALTKGMIEKFEIPVPPRSDQDAIAEVLSALDDKIAANTKLAATAEKYISAKHSEAINKPNTEFLPLSDAFDIDFGEPFKGAHFSEPGEGRPLIRIRDLKTFSSQTWTEEQRPREVLVQPGDVVVGMDAEFRPTTWLGEPGLLNQRVCRVRGKSSGPAFVRESLKDPLLAIENYKTATTVIHLNKKDLDETKVLVPAPQVLAEFEGAVEGLYTYRVSLAAESRLLATTRDALLPQLMSGKLRVKEAEALVSTAV